MNKYLKFKVGDTVVLNESLVCEGKHFDRGHAFFICSFPPCTIPSKRNYFVYGRDTNDDVIRCEIDQIILIGRKKL